MQIIQHRQMEIKSKELEEILKQTYKQTSEQFRTRRRESRNPPSIRPRVALKVILWREHPGNDEKNASVNPFLCFSKRLFCFVTKLLVLTGWWAGGLGLLNEL